MPTQSKEDVYLGVCNAILKLEVSKGHLNWTISDVARESEITRSLIYYYFGKEKKLVLEEAYRFVLSNFFNIERTKTMGIQKRLAIVLKDLKKMPFLFVLYYLEKSRKSEFGKMIDEAEAQLLQAMKFEFPKLTEKEILAVYLKELGAIAYQIPEENIKDLFGDYI